MFRKHSGRLQRELILELSDGDVRSRAELADGRKYISVRSALVRLEREGIVTTWRDDFNYPTKPRVMVRLTETALKTIQEAR